MNPNDIFTQRITQRIGELEYQLLQAAVTVELQAQEIARLKAETAVQREE